VTEYTNINVSDGPKVHLHTWVEGWDFSDTADGTKGGLDVTVDGTSELFPSTFARIEDSSGNLTRKNALPAVRYDDELKIEWEHKGTGNKVSIQTFVLGSGPYRIAVVRDGEPAYRLADNIGEKQINNMGIPDGYKIVKNPDMSVNPFDGIWDDDEGEFIKP